MRNRVCALLVFLCAFSLYAQIPSSPYGKILTLDNSGTQQWIDISTVMTDYFEYHQNSGFPAWLTNGNNLSNGEKFGSINNQPLIFITNNAERARITENGYVGIGTNNPQEALDVSGNL